MEADVTLDEFVQKVGGQREAARRLDMSPTMINRRMKDDREYLVRVDLDGWKPVAWCEWVKPGQGTSPRRR